MIAFAKPSKPKRSQRACQESFLEMLPAIRRSAKIAFRTASPEAREDLVEEAIANAFVAYANLVRLGKRDSGFASALARYAIAQIRDGRRVGNRRRIRDVMSGYAQRHKSFCVGSLDYYDRQDDQWLETVVEDRRAGPAEIATIRIDFEEWLSMLPRRQRKIALVLASGETTSAAAKLFDVTAARISQLRVWLKESWEAFQREPGINSEARMAVAT
jgi:DNA-directed RNA polymerase specialized sigma24 family protein